VTEFKYVKVKHLLQRKGAMEVKKKTSLSQELHQVFESR
jgi:hypothetical protein